MAICLTLALHNTQPIQKQNYSLLPQSPGRKSTSKIVTGPNGFTALSIKFLPTYMIYGRCIYEATITEHARINFYVARFTALKNIILL